MSVTNLNFVNMCTPWDVQIRLTNGGSGTGSGANMYNVLLQMGMDAYSQQVDFYNTNPSSGYTITNFRIGTATATMTLTGAVGDQTINFDLSQFTTDPDGAGVGLDDLDGDGFYDDLPQNGYIDLIYTYQFICTNACNAGASFSNHGPVVLFQYDTQCGQHLTSNPRTGSPNSNYFYQNTVSSNNVYPPQIDATSGNGFHISLGANMNDINVPSPSDGTRYVWEVTMPAGVTIASSTQVYTQAGQVITFTGTNVNFFTVDDITFNYDCAGGSNLVFNIRLYRINDRFNNCQCRGSLICEDINITAVCAGPCPGGGPWASEPQIRRADNSLGFTDYTFTTHVDPTTLTDVQLKRALYKQQIQVKGKAVQTSATDNMHLEFVLDKATGGVDKLVPISANVIIKRGGVTIGNCNYTTFNTSGSTPTQTVMDLDFTACFPAGTILINDEVEVTAIYEVATNDLPSLPTIASGGKWRFYNYRPDNSKAFCLDWIPQLYLIGTFDNSAMGQYDVKFNGCAVGPNNDMWHQRCYGGNYNLFPGEFLPARYFDKIEVAIPAGYEFDHAVYGDNRPIPSTNLIPNTATATTLTFINDGTWVPSLIVPNSNFYEVRLNVFFRATCATATFVPVNPSYVMTYRDFYYANAVPVPQIPPASVTQSVRNWGQLSYSYNQVSKPNIGMSNQTGTVQAVRPTESFTVRMTSNGQTTAPYNWLALENTPNVTITQVVEVATSTVISPLAYATGKMYHLSTVGIASGAFKEYRIDYTYTTCSGATIKAYGGWNCGAFPASPDDYLCNKEELNLSFVTQTAEVEIISVTQPTAPFNLCENTPYQFDINNAQSANVILNTFTVTVPSGMNPNVNSFEVEYPKNSGNWAQVTVNQTGNVFVLNLFEHPNFPVNGIPGTILALNTNERQMSIRWFMNTNCDFVSGSKFTIATYAQRGCGQPATGSSLDIETVSNDIAGADPGYKMINTFSITSGSFANCGSPVTIQNNSQVVLSGTTSTNAYALFEIPPGMEYVPNSFVCSSTICPTFDSLITLPNGYTAVRLNIPAGLVTQDVMTYTIQVQELGASTCGDKQFILRTLDAAENLPCVTAPGGVCNFIAVQTGIYTQNITITKPELGITTFGGTVVGNNYTVNVTVSNTGALDQLASNPIVLNYYCADSSGTPTGAPIATQTLTNTLLAGSQLSQNFSFTASGCSPTGQIVVAIDKASNCVCLGAISGLMDLYPIATNDALCYTAGQAITIDVLTNDTTGDAAVPTTVSIIPPATATNIINDAEGDVIEMTVPLQGTWSVSTAGSITFTPIVGFTGTPTPVQYFVDDAQGNSSNNATITLLSTVTQVATNIITTPDVLGYQLVIQVTGTAPFTATGTGASGTWSGSTWTSNTITTGNNYSVNFQDANACNTLVVSGTAPVEICDNGIDDDGDGYVDAADPDCGGDTFCNDGGGVVILNETFGSGANFGPALPAGTTNYTYSNTNADPAGYYIITNNPKLAHTDQNAWYNGQDHTSGDTNGYMALFNGNANVAGVFYSKTVTGLCPGVRYSFSSYIANVLNASFYTSGVPEVVFEIRTLSNVLIGAITTGGIPQSPSLNWIQYGFSYDQPAGETAIKIIMRNNSTVSEGNDLAIDDVVLKACAPEATISIAPSPIVCLGSSATFTGVVAPGYTSPAYQWQKSVDNGVTWTNIAGQTTLTFTLNPITAADIAQYRLLASESGNAGSVNCASVSNVITLIECDNPSINVTKDGTFVDAAPVGANPGDTVTYTFVVTNTGNVPLTNVTITDNNAVVTGGPIATLAVGASNATTFTAVHVLTQADINAGFVYNLALATGTPPTGPSVTDNSSDPTPCTTCPTVPTCVECTITPIPQTPSISVTKDGTFVDAAPAGANPGDTVTYTFVVTNTGNVPLTNVTITDNNAVVTGGPIATLAVGTSDATTFTAVHILTQADINAGFVYNLALATGTPPTGPSVTDNSSDPTPCTTCPTVPTCVECTITPIPQTPSISVTKDGTFVDAAPAGANPGDTVTYTFVVTNTGNVPLTNVTITDNNAVVTGGPIATLAVGTSDATTFTAVHILTQADINAGFVYNLALATGTPPTGPSVTDNSSDPTPCTTCPTVPTCVECTITPIPQTPSISVTKDGTFVDAAPAGANPGDTVTYTFVVTNTGNVPLTNVTITDNNAVVTGGPIATLAVGASDATTFTAVHVLTQADINAGFVYNLALATGTPPTGPSVTDNSSDPTPCATCPTIPTCVECTITPIPQTPSISVTKDGTFVDAAPAGANPGDTVTYTFVVTNTGNVPLTNVTITDNNAVVTGGPIATLAVGASDATTFTAVHVLTQADINAGFVYNLALATGTPPTGPSVTDNSSDPTPCATCPTIPTCVECTITPIPQTPSISVTKDGTFVDAAPAGANPGDTVTYTFVVTNTGNVPLTNVTITDNNAVVTGGPIATLAVGASDATTFTAVHVLTQADINAGFVYNLALATGTPPTGPSVTDNSSDPTPCATCPTIPTCVECTITPIPQTPSISVTKDGTFVDAAPAGANSGDTVTYTFVVTNTGNVPLTNVTITDNNAVVTGGPIATLAVGASDATTFTAVHVLTQADINAGFVYNLALATGTPPTGPSVTDNSSDPTPCATCPTIPTCVECTITPIPQTPSISVTKDGTFVDAAPAGANPGDTVTYTFVVTNTGNVPLTNVTITDNNAVVTGGPIATLAVGASDATTFTAVHVLTQADINAGFVYNLALATGTPPTGPSVTDNSSDPTPCATCPVDPTCVECTITPIPQTPSISVTKDGTFVDNNNNGVTNVGDIVTYTFVVTNTGNVPLTNVTITDNNAVVTGGPISLGVGASNSTTFTAVHVITQADIDAGQVNNLALATGTPPSGIPVTGTSSDPTPCATCTPVPQCTTCTNTPLINAVNDIFNNVACDVTVQTGNILTNDTYGITPVNTNPASQVVVSIISGSNPNITIDANGNINLTSGIAAGTYTFTYQICSVASANTCDQATVTINVVDTTAPVWTSALPGNVTVECSAVPTAPTLTGTDTCSPVTITYNQLINPGSCAGNYTIVNTWVASDVSGNQITHVQTVTVQDTTAPAFVETLPANVTVECSAVPTAPTLTATDNCGTANVTYAETTTAGTCAGAYTLTRTWTATDLCGLTATHVQTVTVQDTTAPLLVTPLSNATVTCETIPSVPVLEFSDNCSTTAQINVVYSEVNTMVTAEGSYVTTRTWDVTDSCGNASQFVQVINVSVPKYLQTTTIKPVCSVDEDLTVDVTAIINAQFPGVISANGVFSGPSALSSDGFFTPLNLPDGNYVVTYTNNDPVCPRIIEVTIPVERDACRVEDCVTLTIYNALTPNNDGVNDVFFIENITNPCFVDNTVEIFNRWGVKVFGTKNYNNVDRVFKGESDARATINQSSGLPTGTYYYVLKYTNIEGGHSSRTGYLYLSRDN